MLELTPASKVRDFGSSRLWRGSSTWCSVEAADVVEARGLPPQHVVLVGVFDPLNELHVRWLGGRSACRGITFGLSK